MAQTIRFATETDAIQILDICAPIVVNTAISFKVAQWHDVEWWALRLQ